MVQIDLADGSVESTGIQEPELRLFQLIVNPEGNYVAYVAGSTASSWEGGPGGSEAWVAEGLLPHGNTKEGRAGEEGDRLPDSRSQEEGGAS